MGELQTGINNIGLFIESKVEHQQILDLEKIYQQIQHMQRDPAMRIFFNIPNLDLATAEAINTVINNEDADGALLTVVGEPAVGKKGGGSGALKAVEKIFKSAKFAGTVYYASNADFVEQGMIERDIDPMEGFTHVGFEDVQVANQWVNASVAWFRDKNRKGKEKGQRDIYIMEVLGIGDPNPEDSDDNVYNQETNPQGVYKFNLGGNAVKNEADEVVVLITDLDLQDKNILRRQKFERTQKVEYLGHEFDKQLSYSELYRKMAPALTVLFVRGIIDHNIQMTVPDNITEEDLKDPLIRPLLETKYVEHIFKNWGLLLRGAHIYVTENKLLLESDEEKKFQYAEGKVKQHALPWHEIKEFKESTPLSYIQNLEQNEEELF